MKYLNAAILILATGLFSAEAKLTYKGRRALADEGDGDDSDDYGGKKGGYDADGAIGGKKGGYDADADGSYGGKKAGYVADGSTGGKKGGYDADGSNYGGKKGGYDSDGGYGGKKSGYESCNDDGDSDGGYGGKKGGLGGKKGGCFELRDGDCEICGATEWERPKFLKLRYVSDGAESFYQSDSASSCKDKLYPLSTKVLVSGHGTYDLEDGDEFLVEPAAGFATVTEFSFSDGYSCRFHMSCSEPIVAGDQFGPFLILAGNECKDEAGSLPPFTIPSTPGPTDSPIEPTSTPPPTRPPTPGPTRPPTPEPTRPPTPEPTDAPTMPCVTGTVRVDGGNTVIDIEFNYPTLDPLPSDWVGLYPCSEANLDTPFSVEPVMWAYTCYSRICRFEDPSTATGIGSFTFDDSTLPTYGSTGIYQNIDQILNQEPGCYVILLNRIDGDSPPPYYGICEGNEIELSSAPTNPTPAPVNPTPAPVNPTPAPVNPTPAPVNPTPAPVNPTSAPVEASPSTPVVCESIPPTGCSVCGEGKFVSEPDAVFVFPGQPSVACGTLETAGLTGAIPLDQCAFLPGIAGPLCTCADCPSSAPPTCTNIPTTGCSVCGEGKFVSEPDAVFAFPGQPSVACGTLETAGLTGAIPLDQCAFLPGIAAPLCSCADC